MSALSVISSIFMSKAGLLKKQLWLILLFGLLTGCAGGSYAPVSDRQVASQSKPRIYTTSDRPRSSQRIYRVQTGDTLYSIAFRFGKDYQQLARINDIDGNYRIYPGQLINLTGTASKRTNATSKSDEETTRYEKKPLKKPVINKQQKPSTKLVWLWPVKGKVIQKFSEKGILNKGINIAAAKGDPVHAAAPGEVVYSGSGLLGYGNLIIVKHNNQYLSAYAHNHRLLVKEKDRVRQGQKIAEVGDSGTTKAMLHFEIRRDGKPVNPLIYLP